MTETTKTERWADKLRIDIARDLREISHLFLDLDAEAANHHDDKDMPGGAAMVLLGPSADPEAWGYAQMSTMMGRTYGHGADELDSDPAPPLLVLSGWVDIIREERNQPTDLNATIGREVDYLRKSIPWVTSIDEDGDWAFLAVDDLASDLHKIRAQLENVLHDGVRSEKTETPCERDDCNGALLVKTYGHTVNKDGYYCERCNTAHDHASYVGIRQRHMWSEQADNAWIGIADAAKSIGRSQWTIRQWMKVTPSTPVPLHGRKVQSRRVGPMKRIEVFWPDVREQNDLARRRDKVRHAKAS